jgi:hypothetical protein
VKKISQGGTSYISLRTHDTTSDGLYIQKSTRARSTEIEATAAPYVGKKGVIVAEEKPPGDFHLCNWCGMYVHRRGFPPDPRNRDGISHTCKSCRAELARLGRRAVRK